MNDTITTPDNLSAELEKVNITTAMIARMKDHADALLAHPIASKKDFEAVDLFRKDVKRTRLAGETLFEQEREARHAAWQEVINKKKTVMAPFLDVEERAKARQFEWNFQQEEKAREAEAIRVKQIQERNNACIEMGFVLRDGVWSLEGLSVDAEEVLTADADKWQNLSRSMAVVASEVAERREKERLAAEEVERKRLELEAREAAIKAQEEAIEKEKQLAAAKLDQSRYNELVAVGAVQSELPLGSYSIYSEEQWSEVVRNAAQVVGVRRENERVAAEAAEAERVQREAAIADKAIEDERVRLENAAKEQAELAAYAEQQRIAMDGDMEYVRQALAILQGSGIKMVELSRLPTTAKVKNAIQVIVAEMREMKLMLENLQQ